MMSHEQISVPCRNGNAVVVIITRFNNFLQDCHQRVNFRWQVDKEAFDILRIQPILSMHIQPFELFADDVFKHATLHRVRDHHKLFISKIYIHKPHFSLLSIRMFV